MNGKFRMFFCKVALTVFGCKKHIIKDYFMIGGVESRNALADKVEFG